MTTATKTEHAGEGTAMGGQDETTERNARRGLLRALGLGAGAAVAATSAASAAAGAAGQGQQEHTASRADALPRGVRPQKEDARARLAPRYRETDHVKLFYQTNRY